MIETNNLNIFYGKKQIIKDMSIKISKNGIYTLIGANGSGKTTFMKSLILDTSLKINGEIFINSQKITKNNIAKNIAFMPQFLDSTFPYSVLEVIMMGHKEYIYSLIEKKSIKNDALSTMEELDILSFKDRSIQTLSGGEKAKVFLAKTLCKKTNILLLDEPDSALDFSNKISFYSLLNKIKKEKIILMTSHDILSISLTDYIIPFYDNSNYKTIETDKINRENIKKIYPTLDVKFLNENLNNVLNLFNN